MTASGNSTEAEFRRSLAWLNELSVTRAHSVGACTLLFDRKAFHINDCLGSSASHTWLASSSQDQSVGALVKPGCRIIMRSHRFDGHHSFCGGDSRRDR